MLMLTTKHCLAGHADNIHKLTIARLDSGDAAILVSATGARTFTLKVLTQKIKTIKIEIFIIVVIIVLPINITIKMKMIMVVIRARWQELVLQAVASLLMQGDPFGKYVSIITLYWIIFTQHMGK